MTDIITITGVVATPPRHLVTTGGLAITSFRLASTQRRFDRTQSRWVDAETNWYTVTAFRQLADNVLASIRKGERVLATGRLRIRDWETGERSGTSVDLEADAVGHDLSWGTASWARVVSSTSGDSVSATPSEPRRDGAHHDGASVPPESGGDAQDGAERGALSGGTQDGWAVPGAAMAGTDDSRKTVATPF